MPSYAQHNPEKVKNVDAIIDHYKDDPQGLHDALEEKYGATHAEADAMVHEAADEAVDTQPIAAKSLEGELEDLDTTGAKPLVALKTNARSKGEKIVGLTLEG